jgi:hypothetical protein
LGQQVEVHGGDLLHERIDRVFHFPGINGFKVLLARITHIHPIVLFFFAEEVMQGLVVLIIAERAVYSLCLPFVAAKAANQGSFPFIPKD